MIFFRFLLDIVINAWLAALLVAGAEFVVTGNHIGNASFLNWMALAFVVVFISKMLDLVEIYNKLKGSRNGN